jgi:hypothetical protein
MASAITGTVSAVETSSRRRSDAAGSTGSAAGASVRGGSGNRAL